MPSSADKCAWVQERIELYIDGELGNTDCIAFERHVESCAACREELSFAEDVVGKLRALPNQRCPERVVDEALQKIGEPTSGNLVARLLDWIGGRHVTKMRPAMAAMIVVVAAAAVFVLSRHEQSPFNSKSSPTTVAEHSEKELELAKLDAMLAFAYVGKYTRRTEVIVKQNVTITDRVMRPLGKTIIEPMNPFPLDERGGKQ